MKGLKIPRLSADILIYICDFLEDISDRTNYLLVVWSLIKGKSEQLPPILINRKNMDCSGKLIKKVSKLKVYQRAALSIDYSKLTQLTHLDLSAVLFYGLHFPRQFKKLVNLRYLDLMNARLFPVLYLPDALPKDLRAIESSYCCLDMWKCATGEGWFGYTYPEPKDVVFVDPISQLETLTNLTHLDLSSSGLSQLESIESLCKLEKLQYLSLTDSRFTKSEVPHMLAKLPLKELCMQKSEFNNLRSARGFAKMTGLTSLRLTNSRFNGYLFAREICKLTNLVVLDLKHSQFRGPDSEVELKKLVNLKYWVINQ